MLTEKDGGSGFRPGDLAPALIKNSFTKSPEGWCSYDYHASVVSGGVNVFILATWAKGGGVKNGNFIWTSHTRWSAATPEKPLSILPLLFYRSWINSDPADLRECEISFFLRGDELRLNGANCYFWVHAGDTRWHCIAYPLKISMGGWASEPERLVLRDDETLWNRSWALDPRSALPLTQALRNVLSYGFSFTGFSGEVSGRLALAEFAVFPPRTAASSEKEV